jgi:hypothetical protein
MLAGRGSGHPEHGRRVRLLLAVLLIGVSGAAAATVWAGVSAESRLIRGTAKADRLAGTPVADRMFGLGGNDWLRGLGGDDLLDGGRGQDRVSGGPGNDLVRARDGARDRVYCGAGRDRVIADALDRPYKDCETVVRPKPPPVEPESRTDCSTTNYQTWTWEQCKPGSRIVLTNQSWHCNRPLASYGQLPLKVVINATSAWSDGAAVTVNSGCNGTPGTDVNLIVDIRGEGPNSSAGPGHDSFKTRVNPQNLRITGSFQCGQRAPNAHQDALQLQGGTNIAFVNVVTGDWETGMSTCQGAGGGPFYSLNQNTNIDVLGGAWLSCNHSLNGGNAGADSDVVDAKFRTGRVDGSDPNCSTFFSSRPCVNTSGLRLRNVTCERWQNGRWVSIPPT